MLTGHRYRGAAGGTGERRAVVLNLPAGCREGGFSPLWFLLIIPARLPLQGGMASIPVEWRAKTTQLDEVAGLTEQLLLWRGVTRD